MVLRMADGRPVRPLILLPADPASDKIGGIQTFIRGFVRFAPEDFTTEIVGCSADPGGRPIGRWQDLELGGRTIRFLPVTRAPAPHRRARIPIALRYTIALRLRRRSLDLDGRVLQFHRAGVPLALAGLPAPRIQVVHLNVAEIAAGESRWRHLPWLHHRIEDMSLPAMDRVFVVNRAGVDFYRRRHPTLAARIGFLPTWVDDTVFRPPAEVERSALRREMAAATDIPADARLVLFVGRLEAQKDPTLVVDGAAAAATRDASVHVAFVGDGGLRAEVERRVAASGVADRLHVLGYRPVAEVARLMAAADVLLLASRFEGMPITVLEALASGLPVAATAVGELPTVLTDGETGETIHEHTPTAVADALGRVLAVPRPDWAAGLARAVEPYRARTVLGRFYDAHREVAESHRTGHGGRHRGEPLRSSGVAPRRRRR
jgi:glycosyltransferase involved in cell wall biosynthesis